MLLCLSLMLNCRDMIWCISLKPSGVGRQSSKVEKWMLSQAANRSLSSREQIFHRLQQRNFIMAKIFASSSYMCLGGVLKFSQSDINKDLYQLVCVCQLQPISRSHDLLSYILVSSSSHDKKTRRKDEKNLPLISYTASTTNNSTEHIYDSAKNYQWSAL